MIPFHTRRASSYPASTGNESGPQERRPERIEGLIRQFGVTGTWSVVDAHLRWLLGGVVGCSSTDSAPGRWHGAGTERSSRWRAP